MIQIQMLHYFGEDSEEAKNLGVSLNQVYLSVALASMHIILEIFMLKLEALACEVNLLDYTVACFNGRVGFVPYLDLI